MLVLDPWYRKDELCCNLGTPELIGERDDYIAISYVWGDAAYRTPILCNGEVMYVTLNLAEALRELRDSVAPKRIWADAICIDQTNNEEKNH